MRFTFAALLIPVAALAGAMLGLRAPRPATLPDKPMRYGAAWSQPPTRIVTLADVGLDEAALDRSVDPCFDFYEFACGGWRKSFVPPGRSRTWRRAYSETVAGNDEVMRELLEEVARHPANDPVRTRVGDFYASCMDKGSIREAGLEPLQALFDRADAVVDGDTLASALGLLHRSGVPIFIRLSARRVGPRVHPDLSVRSPFAGLGPPGPTRREDVSRTFERLRMAESERETAVDDVLRIDAAVRELQRKPAGWHLRSRDALRQLAPRFSWDRYFEAAGQSEWDEINVTSVEALEGLDEVLSREKPESLRHFLRAAIATLEMERVSFNLGGGRRFDDALFCRFATANALPEDTASLFAERVLPPGTELVAWGMMGAVSQALRQRLSSVDWMDEWTREVALEKLDRLSLLSSSPPPRARFEPNRRGRLANLVSAAEARVRLEWDSIGRGPDESKRVLDPTTPNASYLLRANAIELPVAILQRPFLDIARPAVVNYGALGTVMGHELTHAMGERSGDFDADGERFPWWSPETKSAFDARKQCLEEQYGKLGVDGVMTGEENAADIGGIRLAWEAWNQTLTPGPRIVADGFTEEQLFFLSYAQSACEVGEAAQRSHAPFRARVLGSLSNLSEFGEAYSCDRGTPMQPEKSCQIW